MRLPTLVLINLLGFVVSTFALPKTLPVPSRLNITTIGAANGESTLECWQLSAPLVQSSQAGTSGAAIAQLGETGATSYTLLPPQFDGGLHNGPAVQYVLLSSQLCPNQADLIARPHFLPSLTSSLFHPCSKQIAADPFSPIH